MKKIFLFVSILFLTGCGSPSMVDSPETLQDFEGRPSVIVFGSTRCPHCVAAVPVFKSEIWDVYHTNANLWINVVNNEKFDIEDVSQGFSPNINFVEITKKECGYVPSWVVLDKNLHVVESSCGGEKNLAAMKKALAKQL